VRVVRKRESERAREKKSKQTRALLLPLNHLRDCNFGNRATQTSWQQAQLKRSPATPYSANASCAGWLAYVCGVYVWKFLIFVASSKTP
jgi:hypothetical protein